MKRYYLIVLVVLLSLSAGCVSPLSVSDSAPEPPSKTPISTVELPDPRQDSEVSLEEALVGRRSVREYTGEPLTLEEVAQLVWSAQGITAEWGGRTAPSAGALYPLEVYVVVGNVEGLDDGLYRYAPEEHGLALLVKDDLQDELAEAALDQEWVKKGAIDIVISAVYRRTTQKYGERGVRYARMEAGHAAQNLYLQTTALDLGMVTVGAFQDSQVRWLLELSESEEPLYIIPVGRK
ncbi:MAG: SagB/ThcOx family dehydrogenase [Dehalococcoidia bacterium]